MKTITITNASESESVVENFRDLIGKKSHTIIVQGEDEMDASDGYHTFTELYEHRIELFIALCKACHSMESLSKLNNVPEMFPVWRSKNHSDGQPAFGGTWFVLGIMKEQGKQITYHLPMEKWEDTDFAETLEQAPEFDGHTPEDVLLRLKNF